ncbi:vps66p [Saccharomyces arboricola H-6]|uniref:Vps66p n=1 Tax=Saccharomyces arboricola (strain H-6 / AS 2.3317 / CBS 10644) TaxID=1160507 RepID=J8PGP0_SACAR|nr:vps66p [Saccharomyces arboricola H-6]
MEKYTNWRDNGTGIAPFLPNTIRKPSSLMTAYSMFILTVKAVVVLPLIIVYILTNNNGLLGLILKFTFSWKEEVSIQGVKKRDVNKSKHYPLKGKLYICNCTSPLDALTTALLAQGPVSLLVPSNDIVYSVSVRKFVDFILSGGLDIKLYGHKITELSKLSSTVNFMFAEGTSSNGKSILPFSITGKKLKEFIDPSLATMNPAMAKNKKIELQTIQIRTNKTAITTLPISNMEYLSRLLNKGVHVKCKINEPQVVSDDLEEMRIALNGGDKYKLVSRKLDIQSKKQFVKEFTSDQRKKKN